MGGDPDGYCFIAPIAGPQSSPAKPQRKGSQGSQKRNIEVPPGCQARRAGLYPLTQRRPSLAKARRAAGPRPAGTTRELGSWRSGRPSWAWGWPGQQIFHVLVPTTRVTRPSVPRGRVNVV